MFKKCEECKQEKISVMRRPNDRYLCSFCNLLRLREMSPTGLIHNDECVAKGLLQHYLIGGMAYEDAFRRLEFILAMDSAMFTRLVPILDELREGAKICPLSISTPQRVE